MNTKSKKTKKTKNTKNPKKYGKIVKRVLIFITVLGFSTLLYYVYNGYSNSSPVRIFDLPLIETGIYSSSTGEVKNIKTNISFAVDKSLAKNYDEQEVLNITTSVINELDYDEINTPEGTEYLKIKIQSAIIEQDPSIVNENFNVYVSGLDLGLTNGYLPGLIKEDSPKNANRGKQLEQIFND